MVSLSGLSDPTLKEFKLRKKINLMRKLLLTSEKLPQELLMIFHSFQCPGLQSCFLDPPASFEILQCDAHRANTKVPFRCQFQLVCRGCISTTLKEILISYWNQFEDAN